MGNIPFVPKKTAKETIAVIEDELRQIDIERRRNPEDPYIKMRREDIKLHAAQLVVNLEDLTKDNLQQTTELAIQVAFEMEKYNATPSQPKDEIFETWELVYKHLSDALTRVLDEPFVIPEKVMKKYTLQRQLAYVETELPFFQRMQYRSNQPPEIAIQCKHYEALQKELKKQLAEL